MTATASRDRLYPALAGVVFAIATFEGVWLAGYLLLIAMAAWRRKLPPWWGWSLALPIGITAFWAASWWPAVLVSVTILALSVMVPALMAQFRWVVIGFLAALIWQTFGLLLVLDQFRPTGFTGNSDMLGLVGLTIYYMTPVLGGRIGTAFLVLSAGATVGVAGARATIMGVIALVAIKPLRVVVAAAAAGAAFALVTAIMTGSLDRYTLRDVASAANDRLQVAHVGYQALVNPSRGAYVRDVTVLKKRQDLGLGVKQPLPPGFHITQEEFDATNQAYPYQPPRMTWFGYGYQSFLAKTHTGQPHTIPVYIVYELGILSAPLFGVIAWAFWRRKLPWWFGVAMIPVWAFSHEHYTSVGGMGLLALCAAGAVWTSQHEHAGETWLSYVRSVTAHLRRRQAPAVS